jgi:hypothetical protein
VKFAIIHMFVNRFALDTAMVNAKPNKANDLSSNRRKLPVGKQCVGDYIAVCVEENTSGSGSGSG